MKRYLALSLICILSVGAFAYMYYHSQGILSRTHQKVLNIMNQVQKSELELDKDILRLRDFSLLDYDSVTKQVQTLEYFCKVQGPELIAVSPETAIYFTSYCSLLEQKFLAVEDFKSMNSAYKNSLFFLHDKTLNGAQSKIVSGLYQSEMQFAYAIMSYSLLSDNMSKKTAEKNFKHLESSSARNISIAYHGRKLLELQEKKEAAVRQIISPFTNEAFEKLRNSYFHSYESERKVAVFYQRLLLLSCLLLLFLFFINVLKIWKSAAALVKANTSLENRVAERTKELTESQKTITEQQQSLAVSAKMSALGEMAGGVAHEINTPLAVIRLRTDQLLESLQEDPIDREFFTKALSAIDQTVSRIGKIVNGLRSFARDGKNDQMSSYSVSQIIDDTLSLCRERFTHRGVQIDCLQLADIRINCRPSEISQVLLNLLNNAYDAIQNENEKWVRIELSESVQEVHISVCDSGKGIPLEIQEKIMQPFFTTKEIGKGTGLGLSISRGIIQNHGGQIKIDNSVQNTKFVLTFPKTV